MTSAFAYRSIFLGMKRLRTAHSTIEFLDIALATWVAIVLERRLSVEFHGWAIWLSTGIVSVAGFLAIKACKLVLRAETVQKIVLRSDFIEGTWIDFYPAADKRVKHVAVLTIALEEDSYRVKGKTFDTTSYKERSSFHSLASAYESGAFYHVYIENVHGQPRVGAAEFNFFPPSSDYPLQYQFTIVDTLHNEPLIGRGFKVEDQVDKEALRRGIGVPAILKRYCEELTAVDQVFPRKK